MKILSSSIFAVLALAVLAVGTSVHAQTTSSEPTFPIAELGNCTDRAACKAYCDIQTNRATCASYAQSRGLIKRPPQAPQGSIDRPKLLAAITSDGGPGKCGVGATDPIQSCKTYCDDVAHVQTCVAYGKAHSLFQGEALQKADKISAALKSGIALPTGCTNAQTCREACQNPSTVTQARSCLAFAKAAGILPPGFNEVAAQKVFSAIASSSAPFNALKDFAQCKGATNPEIIKKCSDFAAQSGLITRDQALKLQTMGSSTQGMMPRPGVQRVPEDRPMLNASSTAPRQLPPGASVRPEGLPLPVMKRPPGLERSQNATTTSFRGFVGQTATAFFSIFFR